MKSNWKKTMTAAAIGISLSVQLGAGEAGTVTLNKKVYEVGEENASVTVTHGTGDYRAKEGKGFGKVEASFSGGGKHWITIKDEPSDTRNDSGVAVTYPAPKSGEEEKSVTSTCTVAKLLDIIGKLGEGFNCFANFDHFYAGNLGSANALELSLKCLPDDLLHSDLPADWTLEGKGSGLSYIKDAAEPKWKGKVSLGEESSGTVDFTAKWGTMEVKKSFTKFKVGILRDEGEHDLWVLKDKKRTTTAKYFAYVLPRSLETQFSNIKFKWEILPEIKAGIKVSDKRNEYCVVKPQGVTKPQTSAREDDIRLIASWKCPSGSPRPYHTATEIETLTVRTPVYIILTRMEDLRPYSPLPSYKLFLLHYAFYDNLGRKVPGTILKGLMVKEKWLVDALPKFFAGYGNYRLDSSGEFWDMIGGLCAVRTYSAGIQRLSCDHIVNTHTVQIDLIDYPPAKITVTPVVAPTY